MALFQDKKIKKMQLWHYFTPKQIGKGHEREKIKITVSFRSYLTRCKKFQKNSKIIQKKKKKQLWLHFKPKYRERG